MKNTKVNTILFIFLSFVLVSCNMCSKVYDCPGFNENDFKDWFTYKDNQQLIFTNQSNQKDTFTLIEKKPSGPYTSRYGSCSSDHLFLSKEFNDSSFKLIIDLQRRQNTSNTSIAYVYFSIKHCNMDCFELTDTGFKEIKINEVPTTIDHISNLSNSIQSYSNVISAQIDTVNWKNIPIYKIYYCKNYGIIGYEEYPSLKKWIKE